MYFDYNFGLYFTLWDRIGKTHRNPSVNLGKGPLDQIKKMQQNKKDDANVAEQVETKPKAA